jgi:AraC-like DNA-binding protein
MVARPTRVRRRSSGTGAWELAEASPAPGLEVLVRGYVGFSETSVAPLRRRETPSGTPVLIVNLGVPLEVWAPGRARVAHADSFVARVSDLPATTAFQGTSAGVQVNFTPLGLHLFCGLAMDELPDPAVGLTELLGAEGRRLTELLEDARDWESRFALLDAAIERRAAVARSPTPSVQWAWRALESSAGRVEIGRLSDRIGCSRRHLIAGFREQIGVPPKTAARIVRFDRAAQLVRGDSQASLARIAGGCGYHDQAHLTREFRDLAGITPAAYRAAALPGFLGVPDDACAETREVNSVQDGAVAGP